MFFEVTKPIFRLKTQHWYCACQILSDHMVTVNMTSLRVHVIWGAYLLSQPTVICLTLIHRLGQLKSCTCVSTQTRIYQIKAVLLF